ncbi:uncharacterized protein LOC116510671 [Thamnophis elegans]|uniref:uncharacterized protein LOC116510671 n=1 Tax=Thamnophis elegans TaxID=35005 RepID=UPI001377D99B|nr:uncharacterized protein LOC116510671 [Thamnophis elegans]XP_032076200.1 uncharacterized protein LOC116510671 [Thamnophis elegans]
MAPAYPSIQYLKLATRVGSAIPAGPGRRKNSQSQPPLLRTTSEATRATFAQLRGYLPAAAAAVATAVGACQRLCQLGIDQTRPPSALRGCPALTSDGVPPMRKDEQWTVRLNRGEEPVKDLPELKASMRPAEAVSSNRGASIYANSEDEQQTPGLHLLRGRAAVCGSQPQPELSGPKAVGFSVHLTDPASCPDSTNCFAIWPLSLPAKSAYHGATLTFRSEAACCFPFEPTLPAAKSSTPCLRSLPANPCCLPKSCLYLPPKSRCFQSLEQPRSLAAAACLSTACLQCEEPLPSCESCQPGSQGPPPACLLPPRPASPLSRLHSLPPREHASQREAREAPGPARSSRRDLLAASPPAQPACRLSSASWANSAVFRVALNTHQPSRPGSASASMREARKSRAAVPFLPLLLPFRRTSALPCQSIHLRAKPCLCSPLTDLPKPSAGRLRGRSSLQRLPPSPGPGEFKGVCLGMRRTGRGKKERSETEKLVKMCT